MTEPETRDFALFSKEKLKAAVDAVTERRRRGLYLSLAAGAGLFILFVGSVYIFFAPYRSLMGEHGISYWPLLLLAPLSLALIGFCVVYIVTLRQAVREFRETLVGKMAEFIDPGIVHETGAPLPKQELEGSLLGALGGVVLPGTDRFRGRAPGASAVSFSDLRLKRDAASGGRAELRSGIHFHATMERKFAMPLMVFPSSVEVSRSGMESALRAAGENVGAGLLRLDDPALGRQILVPSGGEDFVLNLLSSPAYAKLDALYRSGGASLALSCTGDALRVVMLSASGKPDAPGVFDEFDFSRCREFCRDARLCLDLVRGLADRTDIWEKPKNATNQ